MKRYFITGTDTDCGKTYVTCQLLDYLKKQHKCVLAVKPVASGCFEQDNKLISDDVLRLNEHNGEQSHEISPWRFKPPLSPHLAAEQANVSLSAQEITNFCLDQQFVELDCLLIEGAGGLLVPLNIHETWVDVLTISKMPVILVVGMRLGCINHALLTELALKAHKIECIGWIANCIDKDMLALSANITTLSEKMDLPLLAIVPYAGEMEEVNSGLSIL